MLNNLVMFIREIKFLIGLDEANTKSAIISPILNALQWNVNSPYEVQLEYTLKDGKVDYGLLIDNDVKVLIEAKKLGENLHNYEDQIKKYTEDINVKNVNLFILTNGFTWQFYTWLKGDIGIFKFYDLDIGHQEASFVASGLIELLAKKNILSNASFYYIQCIIAKDNSGYLLSESIINTWHKMLDEQHPLLCQLIIDLTKEKYGTNPLMIDVKKIIQIYSMEFNKIRGEIYKTKGYKKRLKNLEQKTLEYIKRLHKQKNTEWINKSDLQSRVSWYINAEKLNDILNTLKILNLIKIKDRFLKINNNIQE